MYMKFLFSQFFIAVWCSFLNFDDDDEWNISTTLLKTTKPIKSPKLNHYAMVIVFIDFTNPEKEVRFVSQMTKIIDFVWVSQKEAVFTIEKSLIKSLIKTDTPFMLMLVGEKREIENALFVSDVCWYDNLGDLQQNQKSSLKHFGCLIYVKFLMRKILSKDLPPLQDTNFLQSLSDIKAYSTFDQKGVYFTERNLVDLLSSLDRHCSLGAAPNSFNFKDLKEYVTFTKAINFDDHVWYKSKAAINFVFTYLEMLLSGDSSELNELAFHVHLFSSLFFTPDTFDKMENTVRALL